MNGLHKNHLYNKLSNNEKERLSLLEKISKKLLPIDINIIYENLEKNFDSENEWYSYTIVINTDSINTQHLNMQFIEYCIKYFPNILLDNLIFKFESEVKYGH